MLHFGPVFAERMTGSHGPRGRAQGRAQGSKGVCLKTQARVPLKTPLKRSCKRPQTWILPLTKNTDSQWQIAQFTGTLAIQNGRFRTFWKRQNCSFILLKQVYLFFFAIEILRALIPFPRADYGDCSAFCKVAVLTPIAPVIFHFCHWPLTK